MCVVVGVGLGHSQEKQTKTGCVLDTLRGMYQDLLRKLAWKVVNMLLCCALYATAPDASGAQKGTMILTTLNPKPPQTESCTLHPQPFKPKSMDYTRKREITKAEPVGNIFLNISVTIISSTMMVSTITKLC